MMDSSGNGWTTGSTISLAVGQNTLGSFRLNSGSE